MSKREGLWSDGKVGQMKIMQMADASLGSRLLVIGCWYYSTKNHGLRHMISRGNFNNNFEGWIEW